MVFKRFSNGPRRKMVSVGALVATVVVGTVLGASPASAADSPSKRELLESCGRSTSHCEFHPQSYRTYVGSLHRVGEPTFNCGSEINEKEVSWSDTTGSTNSVGVSVSASAGFAKTFEVAVEASYHHEWSVSHTFSRLERVKIRPKYVGWVERASGMQAATGWYEMHYNKPFHGHNVWYVKNYEQRGPNLETVGHITLKDRPMTDFELKQNRCKK